MIKLILLGIKIGKDDANIAAVEEGGAKRSVTWGQCSMDMDTIRSMVTWHFLKN